MCIRIQVTESRIATNPIAMNDNNNKKEIIENNTI